MSLKYLQWIREDKGFDCSASSRVWKAGNGQSGSITLRAGEGGRVRGAVSVDPDAKVASDVPRLREFLWTRGAGASDTNRQPLANVVPAIQTPGTVARPQIIESPIKGRIVRWGEGVFENDRVKKGDLIAEIRDTDPARFKRLNDQVQAATQQVSAAEVALATSERKVVSLRQIVEAHEARVQSYETAKQQIATAAKAAVASAQSKVAAAEQDVVSHEKPKPKLHN